MIKQNFTSLNLKGELVPFLSLIALIVAIALLNIPVMLTLWHYSFDDGTYSHAYLIPFIVVYLYFSLYEDKALQFRQKTSFSALLLLIISAYLLFVTTTAQISLGYWLTTLLLLCASINVLFKTNLKIFFPALYFIFLIPLWGTLTIPLQSISVAAVNALMGVTSIPVFVEKEFVHIPSGIFEIADGCSGLRYLLTSLAISSLYAFLYLRTTKNTILFIFVAIFGALLTNWLRIAILIIIGHQTEMTSSLMTDHNMFGWYIYAPFMLLLFKLGGYLVDKERSNNQENSTGNPNVNNIKNKNKPNNKNILLVAVVLIISSTTLIQYYSTIIESNEQSNSLLSEPEIYNYSSLEIITNNKIETHLIYYFDGNKLEGKPTFYNNELIPKGWQIIEKKLTDTQQIITLKKGIEKAVLTVSYSINKKHIATVNSFKKERLKRALLGQKKSYLHWQFNKQ